MMKLDRKKSAIDRGFEPGTSRMLSERSADGATKAVGGSCLFHRYKLISNFHIIKVMPIKK